MEHRSPAVHLVAGSLAVLVFGLLLIPLPGPGLLIAVPGAMGMVVGLALLMAQYRSDDVGSATPSERPGGNGL